MTETPSLAELLRRTKEGDDEARRQLFAYLGDEDRFTSVLRAMMRRFFAADHPARRWVESQDLVQSAIHSGLEHFDQFRGETEAEFFGWFRSILRSKLYRVQRKLKRQAFLESAEAGDRIPSPREDQQPEAVAIAAELRDRLLEAIASLPPDQRLVIELRLRGANATEIGRILGLKPATVRKRESRAVERLRDVMGS